MNPCGASEWEALAVKLGRGGRGGASAERMYRTLTDPTYHKSNNPHGRRLNPRKGSTPMHVMATYALQKLPNNEGNLSKIGELITNNSFFAKVWHPLARAPSRKPWPRPRLSVQRPTRPWPDVLVRAGAGLEPSPRDKDIPPLEGRVGGVLQAWEIPASAENRQEARWPYCVQA